jgi:hypothetical protein
MFINAFVKIYKAVPKLKWGKYKGHFFFRKEVGSKDIAE